MGLFIENKGHFIILFVVRGVADGGWGNLRIIEVKALKNPILK